MKVMMRSLPSQAKELNDVSILRCRHLHEDVPVHIWLPDLICHRAPLDELDISQPVKFRQGHGLGRAVCEVGDRRDQREDNEQDHGFEKRRKDFRECPKGWAKIEA